MLSIITPIRFLYAQACYPSLKFISAFHNSKQNFEGNICQPNLHIFLSNMIADLDSQYILFCEIPRWEFVEDLIM